jgi:hypothetical protein
VKYAVRQAEAVDSPAGAGVGAAISNATATAAAAATAAPALVTLGVELGKGWYGQQLIGALGNRPSGARMLKCLMTIRYTDGSVQHIISSANATASSSSSGGANAGGATPAATNTDTDTDTDTAVVVTSAGYGWSRCQGPVVWENLHLGVVYDARRERAGWACSYSRHLAGYMAMAMRCQNKSAAQAAAAANAQQAHRHRRRGLEHTGNHTGNHTDGTVTGVSERERERANDDPPLTGPPPTGIDAIDWKPVRAIDITRTTLRHAVLTPMLHPKVRKVSATLGGCWPFLLFCLSKPPHPPHPAPHVPRPPRYLTCAG